MFPSSNRWVLEISDNFTGTPWTGEVRIKPNAIPVRPTKVVSTVSIRENPAFIDHAGGAEGVIRAGGRANTSDIAGAGRIVHTGDDVAIRLPTLGLVEILIDVHEITFRPGAAVEGNAFSRCGDQCGGTDYDA